MAQAEPSQQLAVVAGHGNDVQYYRAVRRTISSLGALRLQASIAGITVSTAFLGVGYAAWHYVPRIELLGQSFDPGGPLAVAACVLSMILAIQFVRKIKLYTSFLDESVDIACMLEKRLIDDPSYRLTNRFHAKAHSGTGVMSLFLTSLYALMTMALLGVVLGTAELLYSFGSML